MPASRGGTSGGAHPPGRQTAETSSTVRLIVRARKGDRAALDILFERHHRALRRWARGRLPAWARDLADTDDLVQETILHTFQRLDAFDPQGRGGFLAYLRQAVLNRIRDELRRHRRRPEALELTEQVVSDIASPMELAIGREAAERYERALSALKPEDREAIIGRVEMGYSYDELAEALGKPSREAARKAAERALLRLATRMGHDGA